MDILRFAPRPKKVRVLYLPLGRPTSTAVLKIWEGLDFLRCQDCTFCTVEDGACMVGVNRIVPKAEAEALNDRNCDWVGQPPQSEEVIGKTS